MIIWHWPEKSCYITSCNPQKRKGRTGKVITYFPLDYIPDPNLRIDTTETDHDESIVDSQATSSQSVNQSLTDFLFDLSEKLGYLFDDVNSPVYTPPILDSTGETLYRTNSINEIYHNNTTSSNDVQQPSSDENNEHSFIGGNISQIENNESNNAIVQHDNRRTSSPLPQRVHNRELEDLGPTLQNRRIVPLRLHHREINGNLHQNFGFEDDSQ